MEKGRGNGPGGRPGVGFRWSESFLSVVGRSSSGYPWVRLVRLSLSRLTFLWASLESCGVNGISIFIVIIFIVIGTVRIFPT